MPDLLSGSSGNFFRNNSGGPGANSGNGSCTGKSPSPPPDSLEDISYIDMEDDEMEEVIFFWSLDIGPVTGPYTLFLQIMSAEMILFWSCRM